MADERDMTATDVFKFDIEAARLEYLLTKKRQGKACAETPPVPSAPNSELPHFLRRQAD